jgi:hypothetical protein
MRQAAIAIGAIVAGVGAASATAAAPRGVDIVLNWQGDPPRSAAVDVFPPVKLVRNIDDTALEARFVLPEGSYLKAITLNVGFADGDTVGLALRVWPQLVGLTATVYKIKYTACSPEDLMHAEQAAGSVQGAMKSFFMARALYELGGDDQCSPNNRRRAAKAWLDRAYELVQLKPYFDLSPEAIAAYSNYDSTYTANLRAQVVGAGVKLINDEKLKAFRNGDYNLAVTLNESLLNAITKDANVKSVSQELQSLTKSQLTADGANIEGRASIAGVNLRHDIVSVELSREPHQ